jgi:pimeloyl-ACP methyl ester carboxylesterase
MTPESCSIVVNNVRIAYQVSGPADGPACLLIHGWTGSTLEWATVIPALNALGWQTLAVDCPGHGASEPARAREAYTMHALADLHHDIATRQGIAPAVVLGFSMGGAIAEEYALRHPRAVSALVLLGSAGGDWVDDEAPREIEEALPIAFSAGMEALWEVRARRLYPEELQRLSDTEREARRRRFAETSAEGYVYTLYGLRDKRDTVAALSRAGLPLLIAYGERDEPSIIAAADRLHAAVPGSRRVVVPEAAHFAQRDNPGRLNAALADFLRSVRHRGAS